MRFIIKIIGLIYYFFILKRYNFKDRQINDINLFKKKIGKLYSKCFRKTQYYNNLFSDIKFDIKDLSVENFKKIPILKKEYLKNNINDFYSDDFDWFSIKFDTSGSTGEPIKSFINYKHYIVEQGVIFRHWFQAGYKLRDHIAILRSYSPKKDQPIIKYSPFQNWTYYSPHHMDDKSMQYFYLDMKKKKTKVLRGYPSSLFLFANYCIKNKFSLPFLKFCLTASEVLPFRQRSLIERAFSVKIYDHYGLAETIVMLHDFGDSNYFNCTEYGFLELIETEDPEIKKIIGTNFNNYKFPLLRYDTGDLAMIKGGRITSILGRKNQFILDYDKKVPSVNFYTIFGKINGIIQWQIIQENKNEVLLNLKIDSKIDSKKIINKVKKSITLSIRVKYIINESFEKSTEGKFNPIIQRVFNEKPISF